MKPLSWVVGRGGLLGGAVERALRREGPIWHGDPLPWNEPDLLSKALSTAVTAFAEAVRDRSWQVAWCAGASVVGTSPTTMAAETNALRDVLDALPRALASAGRGQLFVASSAGGVYPGSSDPPFTERTNPCPLAPYGEAKLAQEQLATEWAKRQSVNLLVGRIANLYGPGQDLTKPQGLISQLTLAHLRRQPIGIYVPLDTIRDYLYADDCGQMVAAGLARLGAESGAVRGPVTITKILASNRPVMVAELLAEIRRVTKRPPRVVLGASPLRRLQVRDLRLRSEMWPELDRHPKVPLGAGMHAVLQDQLARLQAAGLSALQ